MKRGVCIGVDTSCYTTSVAAVDENGVLLCQQREILPVKMGECGLRQSDALYQHVCKLPDLFRQLLSDLREICDYEVKCVCVSATPRSLEESYMPVFRAGHAFAKTMAECFCVPLYVTSHQIGHLLAGTHASNIHFGGDFLAIHLSGGTCEMLHVNHETYEGELVGETLDNSAGQMIDRIGVQMGLPFPAGVHMERLAGEFSDETLDINDIPVSVRDMQVSFAGPASALKRRVESGADHAYVAMCTYSTVARTLVKWMANALKKTGVRDVLIMGGVASSSILRTLIAQRVQKQCRALRVHYAQSFLASDNAVGVAIYGALKHKGEI